MPELDTARPCPFCAHDAPSATMIDGEPPVYVMVCTECGATGPKSIGELKDPVHAWNQRFGVL
jgi:transcription elongation factor Elf1